MTQDVGMMVLSFFSCLSLFVNLSLRLSQSVSNASLPGRNPRQTGKCIGTTHAHKHTAVRMQLFRQTR